jgi:hypothetical protein
MQPTLLRAGQKWTNDSYNITIVKSDNALIMQFFNKDDVYITFIDASLPYLLRIGCKCTNYNPVSIKDFEEII